MTNAESQVRWAAKNPEYIRQWRIANAKRIAKVRKEWIKKHPEAGTYSHMLSRCYNPKCNRYKWYGAKGVKVCPRWRESFTNFLNDMGPKPSKKFSIDRINPYGNYEPLNCRWATVQQQAENRRLK